MNKKTGAGFRRGAILMLLLAAIPAGADEITEALDASVAAQRAARESQARVTKLDDEARALREKARAAQWRALQLAAYAAQLEDEAAAEETKRAQVQAELERIASTGTDLMPLMKRMVAELEAFVARDVPFAQAMRRQRVAELKALLDDPQRGEPEKFRRLVEAYRTEVDYGYALGIEEVEMDCAGARGAAALLRVGRVGLYCLTADGTRAARWDRGTTWQTLDDAAVEEVARAVAIAQRKAAPELLVLPVRAPETAP